MASVGWGEGGSSNKHHYALAPVQKFQSESLGISKSLNFATACLDWLWCAASKTNQHKSTVPTLPGNAETISDCIWRSLVCKTPTAAGVYSFCLFMLLEKYNDNDNNNYK